MSFTYRFVSKAAIIAAALALPTIFASAQPGGFAQMNSTNPMQPNPMRLLRHPEVQVELGLSLLQRKKIDEIRDKSFLQMQERMRQTFQQLRTANPQDRQAQMQEMQASMQQQADSFQGELTKEIEEILKPEQVKRLRELDVQFRGPMGLGDPRIANQVQLNPETRTKVVQIVNEYMQKSNELRREYMAEWMQNGGPRTGRMPDLTSRSSPVRRKTDALKKDADKQILGLLSDEELKKWDSLQGEKITFRDDPPPDFARRRGGV